MTRWDDSMPFPWVDGSLTETESDHIALRLATLVRGQEVDEAGRTPFDRLLARPVTANGELVEVARRPVLALVPPVPPTVSVASVDDGPGAVYAAAVPLRQRNWRWIAAALVLVLAATAGMALSAGRSSPVDPTPTVADLASAAGQQPDHPLATGEYWYQQTSTRSDLGLADVEATTGESLQWMAADGTGKYSGRAVNEMANGDVVEQPDVNSTRIYDEAGSLTFLGLTYDQLRSLPSEPQALLDQMVTLRVTVADGGAANFAALASADAAAPAVRRAAIEVLALLGGSVVGPLTDPTGRVGTGIAGSGPEGSWLVVVEPETGVPLAVYLGFVPAADGSADLASATIVTVFGPQLFTYTTD